MNAARDFLEAWTLERTDRRALTREDAEQVAAQWEGDAADNGIDTDALAAAADGSVVDYLLRTYGEEGQELSTDGDHHGDAAAAAPPPPPPAENHGLF